jgi:hypothetical protein
MRKTVLQAMTGILVGVSFSFVLGTVAGDPYHLNLLNIASDPSRTESYRSIILVWYILAPILSFPLSIWWLSKASRAHKYPWIVAGLIVIFWFSWFGHIYIALNVMAEKWQIQALLILSTLALAVTAALTSAFSLTELWKNFNPEKRLS